MSWLEKLNADALPWLLQESDPSVRYLALRDLMDLPATDAELLKALQRAHGHGPIASVLDEMIEPGYWVKAGPGYNPKYRSTVWSITLLAQLGASIDQDERIDRACTYLLDHALASGGQFSISGAPSGTVDCLQGNLCWALLELGCTDARLKTAFEWMARTVTGEGMAPANERGAPLRYYAYKCGPNFACSANNQLPCAWGATKVMLAFSKLPKQQCTPLIERAKQQGVTFLFSTNLARADYPSGLSNKPSSNWWKFGFPVFYVTDIVQILEALIALDYGNDTRLADAIQLVREKQDHEGRWMLEYDYTGKTWGNYGIKKKPNKWVTLRALRVLKAVG